MTQTINGQLAIDFGEPPMPEPGSCPYEVRRWRDKSCCTFRGGEIWTNCRELGGCTWDGWHQHEKSEQLEELNHAKD